MMYTKNGSEPKELPFEDYLPDGTILTNLANEPESRAQLGWVEFEETALTVPEEIPMHKARKALRMLGPEGEVFDQEDPSWMELVEAVISAIPDKVLRGSIRDELDTAPNMVLSSESTQMIRTAIGMGEEQLNAVAILALSLP